MQAESYDPKTRERAERVRRTRHELDASSAAFRAAVVTMLEEWEDEVEAGEAASSPSHLPAVLEFFVAVDRVCDRATEIGREREQALALGV